MQQKALTRLLLKGGSPRAPSRSQRINTLAITEELVPYLREGMLIKARDWASEAVREIRIDVSPGNTVSAVKMAVEAAEVIPSNLQRLSYGGRLLRDGRALGDYQIHNTSTLQMWWCKCMACRAMSAELLYITVWIYVTPLYGDRSPLGITVSENATIFDVKAMMRDEIGVPAGRQRLLFKETELQNGKTLQEYGIGKDCRIQMVGMKPVELMPVSVYIAILDRTISVEVRKQDTIRDLKAMIQQHDGIPVYHQRLKLRLAYGFFNRDMNDADLQDDLTLASINVNRGDAFILLKRTKHPNACPCFECCGSSFHFFVKTIFGKSIVIDLKSFHTVEMIKKRVYDKERIPISKQNLIFKDQELEDDKTLFDYDIEEDSILNLLQRGHKSSVGNFFSRMTGSG